MSTKTTVAASLPRALQAYQTLKAQIVSSELLPGTTLGEVELSRRLGISRTPVREALRMLKNEGLVDIEPHRGAQVAQISRRDLAEAYEVREWIEPPATAKAAALIDEQSLANLREALNRMPDQPLTHEEAIEAERADRAFHETILAAADNLIAVELTSRARAVTQRAAFFVPPGRYHKSKEEHTAILEAIERRQENVAANLMRKHIRAARSRMLIE